MKIATWNVNSIRRRLPILLDWLERHQPDVVCLQETKVKDADFPLLAIHGAGYQAAYRGISGFNGVATLTRTAPDSVLVDDDRFLTVTVDGIPILNTYAPQGYKVGSDKYAGKLEWFARMRRVFEERLDPEKPAVWLGDLNVAPEPIDVYHPDRRVNEVDFHIDARNAYKEAVAWGWVDTFRRLHPERVQYTYWDYFRQAFERNFGWRIDHILTTAPLAAQCRAAEVDVEPRRAEGASDHTIVWAEFDLE